MPRIRFVAIAILTLEHRCYSLAFLPIRFAEFGLYFTFSPSAACAPRWITTETDLPLRQRDGVALILSRIAQDKRCAKKKKKKRREKKAMSFSERPPVPVLLTRRGVTGSSASGLRQWCECEVAEAFTHLCVVSFFQQSLGVADFFRHGTSFSISPPWTSTTTPMIPLLGIGTDASVSLGLVGVGAPRRQAKRAAAAAAFL